MSRIGKMPVALPQGVTVEFKDGVVTVKGGKGTLSREITGNIDVVVEDGHAIVKALDTLPETNRLERGGDSDIACGHGEGRARRLFESA